ncbi:MAG: hypothetical protein ABIN05_07865 [candidate division WOR-3 bacterium]
MKENSKKEELASIYIKPGWCPFVKDIHYRCPDCEYYNEKQINLCNYEKD